MTIRMGFGALALIAALPAFAASGTFTGKLEVALHDQGFTTSEAAKVAAVAARHYQGTALAKLADGFQHLPALPKSDYDGGTLKSRAQAAFSRVLTESLTEGAVPADVPVAGQAFAKAVDRGTEPLATADLVIQGLKDGLRGRALARLADHYAARIGKGIPEKVAYRETMTASESDRSSPVGRPTALDPTPGSMGANVNGMGSANGALTMGGGAMAGSGGATMGGGSMAGSGGTAMGGGAMGRP